MSIVARIRSSLLAVLASALSLTAQSGIAATIDVTTSSDVVGADSHCSLREAISNVNSHSAVVSGAGECAAGNGINDTIVLPAGTYTVSIAGAGEDNNASGDFDIRANVNIQGAGIGATIIDGNHIDRIFDIPVNGLTVSLQDVSIRNGLLPGHRSSNIFTDRAVDGGGIFAATATLGLLRMELSANQAGAGSLSDNTKNNGGDGGALYAESTTLTIIDCVFDANKSGIGETVGTLYEGYGGNGGAILLLGGSATITHSSFTNNLAVDGSGATIGSGSGGALFVQTSVNLNIASSEFDSNQAGTISGELGSGGAMFLGLDGIDVATITQTSITRNVAANGGGINAGLGSGYTIVNSTISDNQAEIAGGGVYLDSAVAHIDFTTITKNDAPSGSGVYAKNTYHAAANPTTTTINLRNSIDAGNIGGNACATGDAFSDYATQGYNIAGGGCPSFGIGDVSSSTPHLAPLADNGGLGMTHLPLATSAALDGGNCAASSIYVDQRGITRPIDDSLAANVADGCDIGSVESNDEVFGNGFD